MAARFFLPSSEWTTETLSGEEARHAQKVLRTRVGDEIELFDGEGQVAQAEVVEIERKGLRFQLLTVTLQTVSPITPSIHLYQAVPKGKNMDLIIQKSVELGVGSIHPLITENTVAISDQPEKKREKWQKIALEASKQCKQAYLPKVHLPDTLESLMENPPPAESMKLVGALTENTVPMKEALDGRVSAPASVALAVGPEGDFSPAEYDLLDSLGFQAVSLGDLVLRVETATLYMVSAVRFYG